MRVRYLRQGDYLDFPNTSFSAILLSTLVRAFTASCVALRRCARSLAAVGLSVLAARPPPLVSRPLEGLKPPRLTSRASSSGSSVTELLISWPPTMLVSGWASSPLAAAGLTPSGPAAEDAATTSGAAAAAVVAAPGPGSKRVQGSAAGEGSSPRCVPLPFWPLQQSLRLLVSRPDASAAASPALDEEGTAGASSLEQLSEWLHEELRLEICSGVSRGAGAGVAAEHGLPPGSTMCLSAVGRRGRPEVLVNVLGPGAAEVVLLGATASEVQQMSEGLQAALTRRARM